MQKLCEQEAFKDLCYSEGHTYVIGTADAQESLENLVDKYGIEKIMPMERRLKRLSLLGKLRTNDQFNNEGDGFFAVKYKQFRAYGWYARLQTEKCFIISHFIFKKKQKLDKRDEERMKQNRQQWEDNYG